MLQRLHFTQSDELKTAGIMLFLFFLGMPLEKWIDDRFLESYKRLLQRLASNRGTTYWLSYNELLKTYRASQAQAAKFKTESQASGQNLQPVKSRQVS